MFATDLIREDNPLLESAALRSEGMLLLLPKDPLGLVLFAPGSAEEPAGLTGLLAALAGSGLAALLDEAPSQPSRSRTHRSYYRAAEMARLLASYELPLGLYGSGRAAARALHAAASGSLRVEAVVACEGGADMADEGLDRIDAPTLFLSDGSDPLEFELNQAAADALCQHAEAVAEADAVKRCWLCANWFLRHMARA